MSNPFAGPTPVNVPFSGTTDANGNLSLQIPIRSAFWTALKMVGKVDSGAPIWEVTDSQVGGTPHGVGRGQRAEIAGLLLAPSQSVWLQVIGAAPNTAVRGRFIGTQHADMHGAAMAVSLQPNTVAIDTVGSGQVPLDSSFLLTNGGGSVTVLLSPSLVGGAIEVYSGGGGVLTVVGTGSGTTYLTQSLPTSAFSAPPILSFPIPQWDFRDLMPSQGIRLSCTSVGNTQVSVVGLPTQAVFPSNTQGVPLFVTTQNGNAVVDVTAAKSQPAPWQTPNGGNGNGTGALAAGGNLTLVPIPAGGLSTYLFTLIFNIVGAAGSFCDLQDDLGNALGWRLDTSQSTPGPVPFPFFGRNIGSGRGVRLHNSSANPTGAINFGTQYNQT